MSDYIKREDAKDALREKVFHDYTGEFFGAMQVLDELPSADVVGRKRGEWIAVDSYSAFGGSEEQWYAHGNPTAYHYCSACKE